MIILIISRFIPSGSSGQQPVKQQNAEAEHPRSGVGLLLRPPPGDHGAPCGGTNCGQLVLLPPGQDVCCRKRKKLLEAVG